MGVGLWEALAPARCAACGAVEGVLCPECRHSLNPSPQPIALSAGLRILTALEYSGAARRLVLQLKLGAVPSAAIPLAEAIVGAARRAGVLGAVVTWVPGRRADIRRRGYDHAAEIARLAAASLGLPCRPLLRRTGSRPDQAGLGGPERRRNLDGAFAAARCDLAVVVVDDLVTSGSTARACAAAAAAAGAPSVDFVAACKA